LSKWIHPFEGRNRSLAVDQNFLWNDDNVYIMDNHRAALWCWLRHLQPGAKHGIFHIDAHYDAAATISDDEIDKLPDLSAVAFDEYLSINIPGWDGKPVPLIRWDNYLYLFERVHRDTIAEYFVATHEIGTPPAKTVHWEEIHMSKLPEVFGEFLDAYGGSGWIVNIDLDYFFSRQPEGLARIHSEGYISAAFAAVKNALRSGRISCLTICLSPECCGGWGPAEELCYQLSDELGLEFRLPENA
jgi:hypothetical protein